MTQPTPALTANRLLAHLPKDELELLCPHMERVSVEHGDRVIEPHVPIKDLYFPLNCLLSMVTTMEDGATIESGSIGREGMSGTPVLLDASETTMPTFVQIPGEAIRINAGVVKDLYERGGALKKIINRYIHTVIVVGSQSVACNRLHHIDARLARWLLMSSDGVGSDEINITHEYLAVMLGVRRAGVSEAAAKLQGRNLIRYNRGNVSIIEREALEAAACECYHVVRAEYERLFS
ncbi:MAG TPA: Crp/Fnr family transcriptional regulator [Pyrinomonadaceae bacterium]|jgi:CRP-like cAMP-binding protein|nr:Crp/Fnr family transcriptional regulator [Pyrinomonadaceae bacterium]